MVERPTMTSRPPASADADPDAPRTDALSFDHWAHESGPALLRFAHLITGSGHDAADAVQDAQVAVYSRWRRLNQGDDTGGPDAYARRVIVNGRISWWRKFGRREVIEAEVGSSAVAGSDPAQLATDATLARQVLTTLPRRQRAAMVLRYYDDLPFAEIAVILECTESTARSYVHRGLGTLRTALSPEDTETARDAEEGHDHE